jgi:hypothetical protein
MDNQSTPLAPSGKNLEAFQALLEIEEKEKTAKKREGYLKAYLWSVFLPPIGIYYFIKYIFFGNSDSDRKAGIASLVLTIVSFVITGWLTVVFFSQATSSLNKNSGQMLQELITPANQKSLWQLYK